MKDDVYERPLPAQPKKEFKGIAEKKSKIKTKYVLYGFIIVLLCIFIGMSSYEVSSLKNINTAIEQQSKACPSTSAASCKALKAGGKVQSGYYVIRPTNSAETVEVYCDMTTDGGGWTLVASVNENNLDKTCSNGDAWFNYESEKDLNHREFLNWENTFTFGSTHAATSYDYKSSAYYTMQAENIMIRHVPNSTPTNSSEATAFLQYQTNNNFLKMYGGNLRNFFKDHYPLKPKVPEFDSEKLLDALANRSAEVSALIPNFYRYEYPSGSANRLNDGGKNMFTTYGMELYVYGFHCSTTMHFNQKKSCLLSNSITSSRASYPYFGMVFVGNLPNGKTSVEYLRVQSYRPSTDNRTGYSNTTSNGNYEMTYHVICRDNGNDEVPNYCDVMYFIKNEKDWKTPKGSSASFQADNRDSYYYYYLRPVGIWAKVIVGYTMFASTNPDYIPEPDVARAMKKILSIVASVDNIEPSCAGPSFPVTVSKGKDVLITTVPPLVPEVTAGYLQFRTYGLTGTAYALCPGAKVDSCYGEYICVGGVRNTTHVHDCNDFTNWNGNSGDEILSTRANKYSHSTRDIHSTIMIFYR